MDRRVRPRAGVPYHDLAMRIGYRSSIPALIIAATVGMAATPPTSAAADPAPQQTITFDGVSIEVPASWPVMTVDGVPGCVRYDRHAVYLGTPSTSDCPARLIGRVATVQILRSSTVGDSAPIARADADGDIRVVEGSVTRVIVTADPGDPGLAGSIAATTTGDGLAMTGSTGQAGPSPATTGATAGSGPSAAGSGESGAAPMSSSPSPAVTGAPIAVATWFSGNAFDTCSAPSLSQMSAWRTNSPYRALGIYVGGVNRGCGQPNLTAGWVATVTQQGWSLLPLYVGLQAPCTPFNNVISTSTSTAAQQGAAAATDAVTQMAALGLGAESPVYLDMESWDQTDATCTAAVMAFVGAWTQQLHRSGYLSGFYSSAGTGVAALVTKRQTDPSFHAPDVLWFARWDDNAILTDPAVPTTLWADHQRVKQYEGGHDEKYGGVTINIDSDVVDAPVANVGGASSSGSLPVAVAGARYSLTLLTSGGTPPYAAVVTSGALPKGLTLSKGGTLSGTPSHEGISTVAITVTDSSTPTVTETRTYHLIVTFPDVPAGANFFDDIAWLAQSGITGGYADGLFHPTTGVSRQAMAAFLYRFSHPGGTVAPSCQSAPFPDVSVSSQFCGDIAWLAQSGITGGYADGLFHPTTGVSRQAMAAYLHRLSEQTN